MRVTDRRETDVSLSEFVALLRLSVTDPTEAARRVLAFDLPRPVLWQALVVAVIATVVPLVLTLRVLLARFGGAIDPQSTEFLVSLGAMPFTAALTQLLLAAVLAHAADRIGRAFGGRGTFDGALHVVVWIQTLLAAFVLAQLVALLVLPFLAGLLSFAGLAAFLWASTNFLTVLHGFQSRAKVFAMMILSLIVIDFLMSLALTIVTAPFR